MGCGVASGTGGGPLHIALFHGGIDVNRGVCRYNRGVLGAAGGYARVCCIRLYPCLSCHHDYHTLPDLPRGPILRLVSSSVPPKMNVPVPGLRSFTRNSSIKSDANTATPVDPIAVTCLTTGSQDSYIEVGKFSAEVATLQRYSSG